VRLSVVLVLALALAGAAAQQPIDPLVRPAEEGGQFSYTLTIGYAPSGRDGAAVNEDGLAYTYRRVSHALNLTLAGRYVATPDLTIGVTLTPALAVSQEERTFADKYLQPIWRSRFDLAASVQAELRIARDTPLDPRVAVTLAYPLSLGVSGGASLLRDPVVLSANLSASKTLDAPGAYLGVGLAAGLVANQEITLSASLGMTLPIGVLDPPRTTIGLRVAHTVDPASGSEIAVRMELALAGAESRAGLAFELSGR
jgi:hypothetical protein